ncbi:Retrovirus-related Pol polyprotein from transposon RE1 [Vitis vinifera]|uniref:Retrovirus-related Pol polyprotein from transposon RE1 n=1 Tax=Vitis vinifera TaxID=29760 RepID=A0A438IH80_VITVI|nr:Retrovirus-related Pol polyprotein from transposon RE1 [Vitis vinifera]
MKTPMSSSIKLDKDEKGKSINSTMYRGMIGYLLYLTASRPDIIYLKGRMDISLWYPKGDNFELIGFLNVNFASCKVERKSTSGTCHFLGHSLVSWHSKKQNSVALSTAEAEYIAVGERWLPLGLRAISLLSHLSLNRRRLAERRADFPDSGACFLFMGDLWTRRTDHVYVRGVEIRLSLESICRIFNIPSVGLRVYESKVWPTVPGFEPREAIQRLCGLIDA